MQKVSAWLWAVVISSITVGFSLALVVTRLASPSTGRLAISVVGEPQWSDAKCLVVVTDGDPGPWHFKVWHADRQDKVFEGVGMANIPVLAESRSPLVEVRAVETAAR